MGSSSEDGREYLSQLVAFLLLPLNWVLSIPTSFILAVLAVGPLPKHVAFIMDGNRRWARTLRQSPSSTEATQQQPSGHQTGFQALKRVLDLCLKLGGVEHVTVYAFAIDNFKRKPDEVDELMSLARQSLIELAGHGRLLAKHKARIRVVGRVHLLPKDVQDAVQRIEDLTKENTGPTLNICIPYSSRDEIAGAVRARVKAQIADGAKMNGKCNGYHNIADGIEDSETMLLSREMMLAHSPPVDILVRTSGVHRLSDFMLWQITGATTLHFVPTYWPAFGICDMLPILLQWQMDQLRRRLRAGMSPAKGQT